MGVMSKAIIPVIVGIIVVVVLIFLSYMVFNQQKQIDDLINAVEENKSQNQKDLEQELIELERKMDRAERDSLIRERERQGLEQRRKMDEERNPSEEDIKRRLDYMIEIGEITQEESDKILESWLSGEGWTYEER
jgi:Skp family chaperone for outer membrane proteins